MRIDKVEIDAFGKLNNCTYSFSDGVNLIYGENESGKSTLSEFILSMFYGLPNKGKQSDDLPARIKYKPWREEAFGGRIYFTDNSGKKLVIERSFKSTKRGDKATLRDAQSWEELSSDDNIGEKYFGLSREGFLKTLYIKSFGADSLKSDDGEIMSRLSNLETSGSEDVSYSKILNTMEKEIFSLKTKTGRGGKIISLEDEIISLNREMSVSAMTYSALENEKSVADNLNKLSNEKLNEAKELENIYKTAIKHEKYLTDKKVEDTKAIIEKRMLTEREKLETLKRQLTTIGADSLSVTAEEVSRARELETKKVLTEEKHSSLNSEKETSKKPILEIILLILGSVFCVVSALTVLALLIPGGLAIFFGVVSYVIKITNSKKQTELKTKEKEAVEKELDEINESLKAIYEKHGVSLSDELSAKFLSSQNKEETKNNLLKEISEKEEEIKNLKGSIPEISEKEDYTDEVKNYSGENSEKLFEKIGLLKSESRQLSERATEISVRIAKETAEIRTEDEIKEDIRRKEEEKQELEKRYASLTKAAEWLNKAHTEIKSNFAPKLNKKASEMLSFLTHEKYFDIRSNDAFSINLKSTGGEIVEAEYMSRGTYDLMYIALRFAAMSVLTDGAIPPVILDDAFSQLDEKRLKKSIELIKKSDEFSQVLLFTCHENYKTIAGADNLIML